LNHMRLARFKNWGGRELVNGELMRLASEAGFEVFITSVWTETHNVLK